MASKNINILLSLVDRFTKPMQKVETATKGANKNFNRSNQLIKSFGASVKRHVYGAVSIFGQLAAKASGLAGIFSVNILTMYGNQCMKLAEDQMKAETQLEAVLKNVKSIQEGGAGAVQNAKIQLMDYASQLQKLGVVGDEVTLSGMQQLATFQLNAEQIKTLSAGMLDLLVQQKGLNGTQQDAVGIANMIGKAMSGQATALSRVGITMSEEEKQAIKFGDANQRAAVIAKVLKNNVGGVNEAMAKTDMGRSKQVLNDYGDMMEEIGKKILPLRTKFLTMLGPIIPQLQGKILPLLDRIDQKISEWTPKTEAFTSKILEILDVIFDCLDTVISFIEPVFGFLIDNGVLLSALLMNIAGGFAAWHVATTAAESLKTLRLAMKGVSAAGGIMNFVLAANPITIVVFAVTALIAVFLILYHRCEAFRNAVDGLWDLMKAAGSGMVKSWERLKTAVSEFWDELTKATIISNAVNTVLAAVSERFRAFIDYINKEIGGIPAIWFNTLASVLDDSIMILKGIIDFIAGTFTMDWDRAWSGIQQIFAGVFNGLVAMAKAPLNMIIEMVNRIISGINSIDFKVPDWVPGIGGTNFAPRVTPVGSFATGTEYFSGGPAEVNEGGRGEIINLPSGSQIIPHDKSIQQAAAGSLGRQGNERKEVSAEESVPVKLQHASLDKAMEIMDIFSSVVNSKDNAGKTSEIRLPEFNLKPILPEVEKQQTNKSDLLAIVKKPLDVVMGFTHRLFSNVNTGGNNINPLVKENPYLGTATITQRDKESRQWDPGAEKSENQGNSPQIHIDVTIQGNVIGNEEFVNQCGEVFARRVQMALANM
ncbi:MAG: hypothetical protein IJ056_04960 [Acidaminococcaceae bacterium]|nr:hypothetical protein [Acidaminococcaceae bacterium]MBQ9634687.1 hypothetical protein [Acidaminococcaceae bacterium]